jgi:predicted Fe-Mo cluster-binding NifX family protein
MKIAIPLHQGRFSQHFGGAEEFALYTIDDTTGAVSDLRRDVPPEHGRGIYPMWLRQLGADVILAGGMGPRAVGIFQQQGIEVVLGVQGDDPETVIQSYLNGTLQATGEACHDHGFHDCGHDHEGHGRGGCHQS